MFGNVLVNMQLVLVNWLLLSILIISVVNCEQNLSGQQNEIIVKGEDNLKTNVEEISKLKNEENNNADQSYATVPEPSEDDLELSPPEINETSTWVKGDETISQADSYSTVPEPAEDDLELAPPLENGNSAWIKSFNDSYENIPIKLNNSGVVDALPDVLLSIWNTFSSGRVHGKNESYQNTPTVFSDSQKAFGPAPDFFTDIWNGFLSKSNSSSNTDGLDLELKAPSVDSKSDWIDVANFSSIILTEASVIKPIKKYPGNEATSTDYCQVCETHTVCKHPKCEISGNCTLVEQNHLTKFEKTVILKYHNSLRNKIAMGLVESQPSASNMNQLTWDSELEYIAQCWANQCQFEHDHCRNTPKEYVGQNIVYHGSTLSENVLEENMENLIDDWFLEYKDFPVDFIPSRPFPNPTFTNHYTQLVWAKTDRIGCARVYAFEDPFYTVYLYCNYAPRGNAAYLEVYKSGEPASQCSENGRLPSTDYSGLCV